MSSAVAALRLQYDSRRYILTERGMGDGKGYGLRYRGVFEEHFVDFPRGDLFPASIDEFPAAAREK